MRCPLVPDRRALLLPVALLFTLAGCAGPPIAGEPAAVRGPLAARAQHPLALTLLGPRPRRAAPVGEGQLQVGVVSAYSSIYEEDQEAGEKAVFDGEFLQSSLTLRYGLGERTDLELEVGGTYATSGFLDPFINDFHSFFGFPDGGRDKAPTNDYLMRIQRDGDVLYDLEADQAGLLDIPLWITHAVQLEDEGQPGILLRAGVELPVGSESRGRGNGELDYGVGVLFEKSLERFTFTGGLDFIWTGQPTAFEQADVELDDVFQLSAGTEYRLDRSSSLLVQLLWYSPMLSDFGLEEINREIFDLGLGYARDLGDSLRLQLAFHEDLVAATGNDFSVLAGLTWSP